MSSLYITDAKQIAAKGRGARQQKSGKLIRSHPSRALSKDAGAGTKRDERGWKDYNRLDRKGNFGKTRQKRNNV